MLQVRVSRQWRRSAAFPDLCTARVCAEVSFEDGRVIAISGRACRRGAAVKDAVQNRWFEVKVDGCTKRYEVCGICEQAQQPDCFISVPCGCDISSARMKHRKAHPDLHLPRAQPPAPPQPLAPPQPPAPVAEAEKGGEEDEEVAARAVVTSTHRSAAATSQTPSPSLSALGVGGGALATGGGVSGAFAERLAGARRSAAATSQTPSPFPPGFTHKRRANAAAVSQAATQQAAVDAAAMETGAVESMAVAATEQPAAEEAADAEVVAAEAEAAEAEAEAAEAEAKAAKAVAEAAKAVAEADAVERAVQGSSMAPPVAPPGWPTDGTVSWEGDVLANSLDTPSRALSCGTLTLTRCTPRA